jgi:hypothetical protein
MLEEVKMKGSSKPRTYGSTMKQACNASHKLRQAYDCAVPLQPVDLARAGQAVAIKIEAFSADQRGKAYGRHFDHTDQLVSQISRESINALKEHFRDELSKDDWRLVVKLKHVFKIN